jgi:hypothetical protein
MTGIYCDLFRPILTQRTRRTYDRWIRFLWWGINIPFHKNRGVHGGYGAWIRTPLVTIGFYVSSEQQDRDNLLTGIRFTVPGYVRTQSEPHVDIVLGVWSTATAKGKK